MFAWLNWKSYLMIAVGFGLVIYVMSMLAGSQIYMFFRQIEGSAIAGGLAPVLVDLVVEPLKYGVSNPVIGAVAGGLLWPLVLFWFILLMLLLVIGFVGGGFNRLEGSGVIPD